MKKNTITAAAHSAVKAKRKAFTLTELLIALIITGILGASVVLAMDMFMSSYLQMDDYTAADLEIEQAFMRLSPEFALIGLGMPNNGQKKGSFALSFRDSDESRWPVTAYFGAKDAPGAWGWAVTVSGGSTTTGTIPEPKEVELQDADDGEGGEYKAYIGPELYYAWAVPTGIKTIVNGDTPQAQNGTALSLNFNPPAGDKAEVLKNFTWDGRRIGVPESLPGGATGRDMRTWLLLPTLRLPLRAERWNGNVLEVTAAPVPQYVLGTMPMISTIMSLDEVHLMQAARLYLRGDGRLVRQTAGEDYTSGGGGNRESVLANNVVKLCFAYDPEERLLSMFIALRGREKSMHGAVAGVDYPSWLPDDAKLSADDRRYHIVAKTLTWRIRN